jgi:hypothetical protein
MILKIELLKWAKITHHEENKERHNNCDHHILLNCRLSMNVGIEKEEEEKVHDNVNCVKNGAAQYLLVDEIQYHWMANN